MHTLSNKPILILIQVLMIIGFVTCWVLAMAIAPPPGKAPCFAQLYVLDNTAIVEAVKGMGFAGKLKDDVLRGLAEMLKLNNGYIRKFVQAAAIDAPEVAVQIHGRPGPQARSYTQGFLFAPFSSLTQKVKTFHSYTLSVTLTLKTKSQPIPKAPLVSLTMSNGLPCSQRSASS